MKTTVKTLWIAMLLMLLCSFGLHAAGFAGVAHKAAHKVTASFSSVSKEKKLFNDSPGALKDFRFTWSTDMELAPKPVSEILVLNQLRLRRAIEDNSFLKNILIILCHHENLLVQGWIRQYDSDSQFCNIPTGCDYYVYTLRRILI